jgi:enamine deaminase RidA (YjgF/YER057c/UK114 family)
MNDANGGKKDVYPIGKKNPNLPFYPAVRAGDFIFVSGQVAKDPDGNMISGTIEDQTQGTIEAIRRILAGRGCDALRCCAGHHLSRRCARLRPVQ